jgi:hypothetical protein
MTGERIDDNHGLDSVPADEWRSLRANLVGDGSTALERKNRVRSDIGRMGKFSGTPANANNRAARSRRTGFHVLNQPAWTSSSLAAARKQPEQLAEAGGWGFRLASARPEPKALEDETPAIQSRDSGRIR